MASARDIPRSALLHASVLHRLQDTTRKRQYKPRNNHGSGQQCLVPKKFVKVDVQEEATHGHTADHTLYALNEETVKKYREDAERIAEMKNKAKIAHAHAHSS